MAATLNGTDSLALCRDIKQALNDWIHQYAPDLCETYRVEESEMRIRDFGGTLYYIAKTIEKVSAVEAAIREGSDGQLERNDG